MDELGSLILGEAPKTAPTQRPVNNPGNLRPIGGSSGFQQFKSAEEGIAAADKNLQIYGEKHGINTLRGVISRWAPPTDKNDTEAYINTVAKKIGLDPNQQIDLSDPVQRHIISGAMFTVEKGTKNLFKLSEAEKSFGGDELGSLILGKTPAPAKPQVAPQVQQTQQSAPQAPEAGGTAVGRAMAGMLQKQQEKKRSLGESIAGGIDTLYGATVPAAYGAITQALARTVNTPERAEQIGQAAASSIDQPLGKAFGITGKESYQHPLGVMGTKAAEAINHMFNVLHMTPEQISEKIGIPAADIRNMAVTGSFAVPGALKEGKAVAGKVTQPLREMAAELQVTTPQQMQAQFAAKKAPAGSAGAAAASTNPYAGQFTGEELGGSETFPKIKLTKMPTDVSVAEQQLRSKLFQEVLPGVKPRPGVVTGNENLLRNEHALANMADQTQLGLKMKEQIANEQIGLSKFAEDRVNATGASKSLIDDEQRGQRINDVFHGIDPNDQSSASITGYLNQAKQQIYDSAYAKVGDNKINSSHADTFFDNPQTRATYETDGTLNVLEGAKKKIELAKTVGFELPDGKIAPPGSVAAFDAVRKSMNSIWSPDKANAIRKINQAIDKDIAAVADPALYKLGDNVHKLEKTIFGSKGINKLFGEADANGVITSSTPLEKIPSKLNNLPKDQWRHIRDTLNDLANGRVRNAPEGMPPVSPELRESAKAAVAEIDGALAREVYKAGAGNIGEWSSKKANNVMNSVVGQKIVETFPPEEVQNFHKLNLVGQYTPPLKYEGAALQQRRLGLLEKNLPAAGAAIGSTIGGYLSDLNPATTTAMGFVGREAGSYLQAKKAARAETKAVKKMEKEMQKAAKLGTKLEDIGK